MKICKTYNYIFTYNYSTWGLTKIQEELDRALRKQLRKLWNNPFEKNRYVPLSNEMNKAKWTTFGYMPR